MGSAGQAVADATVAPHEHVRCPRCSAGDARVRYRLVTAALVTCRRCGQSYVDPRAPAARLAQALQGWAEQDVIDAERLRIAFEPATLAYYARFLARIERHRRLPGRRLLDVGCSTGALLTVARDAGWEPHGVEIGRASAEFARVTHGFAVRQGSLQDYDAPPASFDTVTLVEVIEHLPRPMDALAAIHRLLRPGGLLLVTTPNLDSLFRRLFGARWWVINCEDEHIVLFNAASLAGMLEACGFEVVERRIRGLDLVGMARELRAGLRSDRTPPSGPAAATAYYEGRATLTRVKRALAAVGLLAGARALLRALDATYGWRFAPTYAMGEQLVMIARRRVDGAERVTGGYAPVAAREASP